MQPLNALFGCINRICIFEFACGPQTLHVRDVSYEHVVETLARVLTCNLVKSIVVIRDTVCRWHQPTQERSVEVLFP